MGLEQQGAARWNRGGHCSSGVAPKAGWLTRALVGYFYNAPHWGGGGGLFIAPPPHLTPKLPVRFSKFKDRWLALENLLREN